LKGGVFRLRGVRVEPGGVVGLIATLGGSLAAAAYLVDSGWRLLLSTALLLWSLLAAGRLWTYLMASALALKGLPFEVPSRAVEGARFSVVFRLPRFIPPGSLRVTPSLPRGLRAEGVRHGVGRVEVEVSGRIGVWCVEGVTLESVDPLGAFRFQASAAGRACVTVTPRPAASPIIATILGRLRSEGSGRQGAGIDYYTFREYQFGDEPRMIEWKATARLRVPVVKETEEARVEEAVAVAFVGCLEDYDLEAPSSPFEEAARMAYGLVAAAVNAGERVHLYVAPHTVDKPLEVGGPGDLVDAGEAIARGGVKCGDGVELPALDGYERAVVVASRRLPVSGIPVVTPGEVAGLEVKGGV